MTNRNELKRSAAIRAALREFAGMDEQAREHATQLLAHLYKNGHRTPAQLKTALHPATLEACFG